MHSICFCRVPVTHLVSRHFYPVYGVLDSVSRLQRNENICHILVMQLCRPIVDPGSACDVFVSDYHVDKHEWCVEFSRPYRILRIKTLTKSQSVLFRCKQVSRYIFATQTDVKSMLRINIRVAILTEDFIYVRSFRLVFVTGYRSLIEELQKRRLMNI